MEARAFVDLVIYVESSVEEEISRLPDKSRLKDFGRSKKTIKFHFKEQLLWEAQTQSDGKNILLVFEKECSNS